MERRGIGWKTFPDALLGCVGIGARSPEVVCQSRTRLVEGAADAGFRL